MGVIDDGIRNGIFKEDSTRLQNAILHDGLKKRCTEDALKTVCDVIIGVTGNPRMKALGNAMKERLVAGKYCVCVTALPQLPLLFIYHFTSESVRDCIDVVERSSLTHELVDVWPSATHACFL